MEYLQYAKRKKEAAESTAVLNLIINGIPSILSNRKTCKSSNYCFKPYYKWNTFNTISDSYEMDDEF